LNGEEMTIVRFFREARRRKVFRTAALYVLGAWLALQVADVLFPGFGISNAAIQSLVWAAVLGFPVALVFGWLFDIGPGGIRRTVPAGSDAAAPQPLTRTDFLLLAAFAAVALALLYRAADGVRRAPADPPVGVDVSRREGAARLENSIAVLPFANISNEPDNEYFCDGISEEILNALSGFRQLNVIGRTSSFAFKGSDVGIDQISSALGVGHVLQGSVRKAGNRLRISAQLLDEAGRQVWTETFDRDLKNVFDIQSEIAAAVAAKVAAQVTAGADTARHPDLDAYQHFLAGRELLHRRDVSRARAEFQRAIEIDPDFAEAHAEWAISRLMGTVSDRDADAARAAIDRALELQPKLLRAQAAQGFLLLHASDPAAAEAILRDVLAQDPNMSDALNWLSNSLMGQGRSDDALAVLQRAVRIDPLHPAIAGNLAQELVSRGKEREALDILENLLRQPNPGQTPFYLLADQLQKSGRLVEGNALGKEMSLRGNLNHYLTARSYGLFGDWHAVQYWLDREIRDFPKHYWNPYLSAEVSSWQGRHGEALQRFRAFLTASQGYISGADGDLQIFYGALLARAGEYAAAIEQLEPLIDPARPVSTSSIDAQMDGPHALAWSYLRTGATVKATALLSKLWQECKLAAPDAADRDSAFLMYCADTALLSGERDVALDWLERAVAAGWRDYYLRQDDPYWAVLEDDPRFRAQMEIVRKDVDRQRAEVARIDAAEDFVAKVDAAMAAHDSTTR
jgi:TolB-like protein/predicted Zn-dependent protease